jgi:translation initiation factor IF-3
MRGQDTRSRETRVNERIRAREVRVIDEDGQMLGVMTSAAALALARERDLDLVEVQPMAVPPVCKILDWGRFKYEQSKKENEARKHQKVTQLREIRMKPRTGGHDVEVKVKKIHEFLAEGDKVKVSVAFRGRELAHPELGRVLLEQISQDLKGVGTIERPPLMEGKMMSMIVSRAPGAELPKKPATPSADAQPAPAKRTTRTTQPPATAAAPADADNSDRADTSGSTGSANAAGSAKRTAKTGPSAASQETMPAPDAQRAPEPASTAQ